MTEFPREVKPDVPVPDDVVPSGSLKDYTVYKFYLICTTTDAVSHRLISNDPPAWGTLGVTVNHEDGFMFFPYQNLLHIRKLPVIEYQKWYEKRERLREQSQKLVKRMSMS